MSENTVPEKTADDTPKSVPSPLEEGQGWVSNSVTVPPPPKAGDVPVLQKLSSPPFPRSGFPLLGIMASVYEHVVTVAARARGNGADSQNPHNASEQA